MIYPYAFADARSFKVGLYVGRLPYYFPKQARSGRDDSSQISSTKKKKKKKKYYHIYPHILYYHYSLSGGAGSSPYIGSGKIKRLGK